MSSASVALILDAGCRIDAASEKMVDSRCGGLAVPYRTTAVHARRSEASESMLGSLTAAYDRLWDTVDDSQ